MYVIRVFMKPRLTLIYSLLLSDEKGGWGKCLLLLSMQAVQTDGLR